MLLPVSNTRRYFSGYPGLSLLTTAINKEKPNKFLNTGFISSVFPDSTDYRRKTFIGLAAGGDIIPIKYTDVQIESASSGYISK